MSSLRTRAREPGSLAEKERGSARGAEALGRLIEARLRAGVAESPGRNANPMPVAEDPVLRHGRRLGGWAPRQRDGGAAQGCSSEAARGSGFGRAASGDSPCEGPKARRAQGPERHRQARQVGVEPLLEGLQ